MLTVSAMLVSLLSNLNLLHHFSANNCNYGECSKRSQRNGNFFFFLMRE